MSDLLESRLKKFFKIVEWTIFLGLCMVSYFAIIKVWEQYQSYDSNFKRSTKSGSDVPTVLIYFRSTKNQANGKDFEFGTDFNLSYSVWGRSNKTFLNRGLNNIEINARKIQVRYEPLKYPGCLHKMAHKISSNFISKSEIAEISIHFNKSILTKNLPNVNIHLTSEKNAYGFNFLGEYFEGQYLIFYGLQFGKELWIRVHPEKYLALDKSKSPKSRCEYNSSFYESFDLLLIEEIFKNCGSQCLPYSSINISIPMCKTEDELICAYEIFNDVRVNDTFVEKCQPSCSITQYVKTLEWIGNWNPVQNEASHDFWVYYSLSSKISCTCYTISRILTEIGFGAYPSSRKFQEISASLDLKESFRANDTIKCKSNVVMR